MLITSLATIVIFFTIFFVTRFIQSFRSVMYCDEIGEGNDISKIIWKKRKLAVLASAGFSIIFIVLIYSIQQLGVFGNEFYINYYVAFDEVLWLFTLCMASILKANIDNEFNDGFYKNMYRSTGYSVINQPYTTIIQSLTSPPFGRFPTEEERNQWAEMQRDFASPKAQYIIAFVLYYIILIEFLIVSSVLAISHGLSMNELFKSFFKLVFVFTVSYVFISFVLSKIVKMVLDLFRKAFKVGYSKTGEWTFVGVHSILVNGILFAVILWLGGI